MRQHTIKDNISFSGVGLHTGVNVNIILKPACENTGVIFKRVDLKNDNEIRALYSNVINTMLGTVVGNKNLKVQTIEHIMSAIWATNIDNIIIEIDNYEVPILDGSAIIFIKKILEIGIVEQKLDRKYLIIKNPVKFQESNKLFEITPFDGFKASLLVEYNYGKIGKQIYDFDGKQNTFIENVALSRTFCNITEVENMKRIGFAKGGFADLIIDIKTKQTTKKNFFSFMSSFFKKQKNNLIVEENNKKDLIENVAVYGDNDILNKSGLRCENEVVKHKTIDLIGDLFTSGYHIKGNINVVWGGHTLHNKFLKLLFSNSNNYEIK